MPPKPFEYTCFISYRRLDGELGKVFIDSLRRALENYLEPYAPRIPVFIDDRMSSPTLLEETLSRSLCKSCLMVMVLTPAYFDPVDTWCAREYQLMLDVERQRMSYLPDDSSVREHGLIVPILFRGAAARIPDEIRKRRLYADFGKYTLADADISHNPSYIEKIQSIASGFEDIWGAYEELDRDPCAACTTCTMPTEDSVKDLVRRYKRVKPAMPSRYEAPA